MQINVLWAGREYYSIENCILKISKNNNEATSSIVGYHHGIIYKVEYHLITNANWQTTLLQINSYHNNVVQSIRLEGEGNGNWLYNSKPAEWLAGCIDVDIPLTPFTNTLPIRRLKLKSNQSEQIKVIYCDLLQQQIKPITQQYTCLTSNQYKYQNVPNDFEATITVDEDGLVEDYPELFVRKAVIKG